MEIKYGSFLASDVDLHKFQCGSRSSIFGKCGSRFKFKQKKFLKFWLVFLSWIRIQPTKIDADPCGSGSGSATLFLG